MERAAALQGLLWMSRGLARGSGRSAVGGVSGLLKGGFGGRSGGVGGEPGVGGGPLALPGMGGGHGDLDAPDRGRDEGADLEELQP